MKTEGEALSAGTLKKVLESSYGKSSVKQGLDGYEPVSRLTDRQAQVCHSPKTGHTTAAHRGTQGLIVQKKAT